MPRNVRVVAHIRIIEVRDGFLVGSIESTIRWVDRGETRRHTVVGRMEKVSGSLIACDKYSR